MLMKPSIIFPDLGLRKKTIQELTKLMKAMLTLTMHSGPTEGTIRKGEFSQKTLSHITF